LAHAPQLAAAAPVHAQAPRAASDGARDAAVQRSAAPELEQAWCLDAQRTSVSLKAGACRARIQSAAFLSDRVASIGLQRRGSWTTGGADRPRPVCRRMVRLSKKLTASMPGVPAAWWRRWTSTPEGGFRKEGMWSASHTYAG
jgi:hypothetical protein